MSGLSSSMFPSAITTVSCTPPCVETMWSPRTRLEDKAELENGEANKSQLPNMLSINVLFEFEDIPFANKSVSWNDLDISLQLLEQKSVKTGPDSMSLSGIQTYSQILPFTIHGHNQSMIISEGDTCKEILQQSIDIPLENTLHELSLDLFQLNLIFKEKHETEDWCVNASCYIGLQSARKVLYPIRCSFPKLLVDSTGRSPTFYCSFCVKRAPKQKENDAPGLDNRLFHNRPTELDIRRALDDQDCDRYSIDNIAPVEPSSLVQSSSHGMRPIGPNGRLMTRLQRATFLSIRKKFASQSSRDWKRSLLDSDLYPLFTLGRDECAKEMGTCSTWLKVRMRERGIKVWPNRKLIHSTGVLYRLKKQLAEISARLEESPTQQDKERKRGIEEQIAQVRSVRMKIVQESCTRAFFEKFRASASETVLDPDWEN